MNEKETPPHIYEPGISNVNQVEGEAEDGVRALLSSEES